MQIDLVESNVLATLQQLKRELMCLRQLAERTTYSQIAQQYTNRLQQLSDKHRERKRERDRKRTQYQTTLAGETLTNALNALKRESQQDSLERRRLKQEREKTLMPLTEEIAQAEQQIQLLKQQYDTISRQWSAYLQATYAREHCGREQSLSILYQDDALIVVDKPADLLSVPGRRYHLQDSVLCRLRCQLSDYDFLQVAHRLDQATSGILVLAVSPETHKALGQQFAKHQVCKTYEAILRRPVSLAEGVIELPLWSNPDDRPRQSVNADYGKPSVTHFKVLQAGENPRVEFVPHTGRTHQLRVHAAHPQGLNSPIVGDVLYGQPNQTGRLCLHGKSIRLIHPITQKRLHFTSEVPF